MGCTEKAGFHHSTSCRIVPHCNHLARHNNINITLISNPIRNEHDSVALQKDLRSLDCRARGLTSPRGERTRRQTSSPSPHVFHRDRSQRTTPSRERSRRHHRTPSPQSPREYRSSRRQSPPSRSQSREDNQRRTQYRPYRSPPRHSRSRSPYWYPRSSRHHQHERDQDRELEKAINAILYRTGRR